MSGKSIIVVGGTGTGKTTLIKERLKNVDKRSLHLYDVNNEYTEFYTEPFGSFERFAKKAQRLNDAVIVFEEATIFLSNKGSNSQVRDILVRKRHTNCTIFFVFHSLRSVPRWVYDLSNFVVLLKTNDSESSVVSRFEDDRFTQVFLRVQKESAKNQHYSELFSIY